MTYTGSTIRFSATVLKASLRDIKSLAITLGLPLFMLFTFWLTTMDSSEESSELREHMLPAVCAMSVMMAGQTQATRLVRWREQGGLRRFALVPVPIGMTITGISISQILIGFLQGVVFTFTLFIVLSVEVTLILCLQTAGVILLIGTAFISLGTLLSAIMNKSHVTGYAFFGIFIPMFFIGSFPLEELPPGIVHFIPYLPTTMGIRLVNGIFIHGEIVGNRLFPVLGLILYTILFGLAGWLVFRKKEL